MRVRFPEKNQIFGNISHFAEKSVVLREKNLSFGTTLVFGKSSHFQKKKMDFRFFLFQNFLEFGRIFGFWGNVWMV